MIQCNYRYYTLDFLSESSLFLIDSRLKQFLRDLDITDYPLDCFALLEKLRVKNAIHIDLQMSDAFSDAFDAQSAYFPELDSYLILMKAAPSDWKDHSTSRRFNFTLAHELGHILLDHLLIPEELKSQEQVRREENEADEFAGRLLMPERMILQNHFASRESMSAAFLVSERALYTRLNNLKRLDLFRETTGPVCPVCGNGDISPGANYCCICGAYSPESEGYKGSVIAYSRLLEKSDRRILFCPECGYDMSGEGGIFCLECHALLGNYCADDLFGCRHLNPSNARFCERCGRETDFMKKGRLMDWEKEREAYIRAVTQ